MIELDGISKSYVRSRAKAVNNLSFTARDGEIFGFLGPNGAGKTTTIKLITGILAADGGKTAIDGISIDDRPLDAKRRFTYVPDTPELFDRLKGAEYLRFIADVYGVDTKRRMEAIDRYATLFDIRNVLHETVSSYSHGMRQKLLLTASLLPDPHNWILDEPIVGLDPESAFKLKEIMRERAADGKTVFFSTHIMEVAERLCDRIGIIHKGILLFEGSMGELKNRHDSTGTATLEDIFLRLTETEAVKNRDGSANTAKTIPGEKKPVPTDNNKTDSGTQS